MNTSGMHNVPPVEVSRVHRSHRVDVLGNRSELTGAGRDTLEYCVSGPIELTDQLLQVV